MTRAQRAEALTAATDRCGVAPTTFVLRADDELDIKPDPNEGYESVACALAEIKKLGVVKMGFVGNKAYVSENR